MSFRSVGNATAVASRVVMTRPGRVSQITGHNNGATDVYIQLHEATALPANTTVPAMSVLAFAGLPWAIGFAQPRAMDALTVAASSTERTLTVSAGTPVTIQAEIEGGSV